MVKRYLKQACGVEKKEDLPVLLKSEMDYLLDMVSAIINKIPYAVSKDLVSLSPADSLFAEFKHEYLPQTKSKLRSINEMIARDRDSEKRSKNQCVRPSVYVAETDSKKLRHLIS